MSTILLAEHVRRVLPGEVPVTLVADVTQGAIHRVFMEEVDVVWQGAAFRHTMGFEAGPNDITWGPDGCLYVGHIGFGPGSSGRWGWKLKKFGFQRLRPTGKTAFEFEKIEATADGFRVTFTQPVQPGFGSRYAHRRAAQDRATGSFKFADSRGVERMDRRHRSTIQRSV